MVINRRAVVGLLASVGLLVCVSVAGAETECPAHFAAGREPALTNEKLSADVTALCYRAFGVLHSALTKTPLWSAEHLTGAALEGARRIRRHDAFHSEGRLRRDKRAELADYVRSGFDRGHMTPAGDMPDTEAQAESFSLANMVPQAPQLNRGLWEGIESALRNYVRQQGDIFVVTGPAFTGQNLKALRGRVLVPTAVWKAVYDPNGDRAGAYFAENDNDATIEIISIARLRTIIGIDPFPSVAEAVKEQPMPLPQPVPYRRRNP